MRSEEDKVYLANKHKGGEANVKGGLYEDYYAVYQMVACIAKYKRELDGVAFQTQLEDTFVDDLLIEHPKINVYHQLKNTQQLSWNTKPNGSRTVVSDFEKQIEDCEDKDETFALKLEVISSKFRFLTFAVDDEKKGSEVLPGIGGWVYPRLGLGGMAEKNSYIPKMVLERI